MTAAGQDDGSRLASQERRLRLLLVHLAGRAVRSRVEIDDLVQEVWLRALDGKSGLPPFEPGEARLWGLLRTLARNVVVDVARAVRARHRAGSVVRLARSDWSASGARESRVAEPGPGPATVAGRAEQHQRLLQAFEALAPEHRRVIGLRQIEGLSAKETAARMARTETAVHSLFRRALAAWEQAIPGGFRDESGPAARLGSP
jgi:RNA polymerase sigma-70 factor (ECF subfamily)